MQKPTIIKNSAIAQQYNIPEMPKPKQAAGDVNEKARKYDQMVLLLNAQEQHYQNMIQITKSYMNKDMESPIDFYQKGTLIGYEDVLSDIRILLNN